MNIPDQAAVASIQCLLNKLQVVNLPFLCGPTAFCVADVENAVDVLPESLVLSKLAFAFIGFALYDRVKG